MDVNLAAHGVTALHAAAEAGELECAQVLLKVHIASRLPLILLEDARRIGEAHVAEILHQQRLAQGGEHGHELG